jgi:hypothetical protein
MSATTLHAGDACHPDIDRGKPQFIVGYGSLMQAESRRRTAPEAGDGQPVMVTGYQRTWNFRGPSFSPTTYLGLVPQADGRFNALVYSMQNPAELLATDARERGYCRSAVTPSEIEMLGVSNAPAGQVWIYTVQPERAQGPDNEFPIVQSYVDIFIGGCIEIGDAHGLPDFATDCVRTTHGWSAHWVNDRLMPRRPFEYQPLAGRIDGILQRTLPDLLKARVIE